MARQENPYGREQLVGTVDLPLHDRPTLRGSKRRNDPDFVSSTPYVPGLTGTSLTVEGSTFVATAVNFVSDDFQAAIDSVNATLADVTASDADGRLEIKFNFSGQAGFIRITAGDAAPLLGFEVAPVPGSASYAGELATAPPHPLHSMETRQGTALHVHGENYLSEVVNRAAYGATLKIERYLKDYEKDAPIYVDVPVTVSTHPISTVPVFYITDDALRVVQGLHQFGINVTNPTALQIEPIVTLLDLNGSEVYITGARGSGTPGVGTPGTKVRVDGIFLGDATTALDDTNDFAVWTVPDGRSIFGVIVPTRQKGGGAITSIRGNLVEVPGATFITNRVQPGDTAEITGGAASGPFTHVGEFVVEAVFTEEILSLRGKGDSEPGIGGFGLVRPTKLNPQQLGTLVVYVGAQVPAYSLAFRLDEAIPNGNYIARVLVGRRIRDASPTEYVGRSLQGNKEQMALELWDHINRTAPGSDAHPAAAINVGALSNWANGDVNGATDLQDRLDKLYTDLASITSPVSGTDHVGGAPVSSFNEGSGTTPFSIVANPLVLQLRDILALLSGHVVGTNQHHLADVIDYAGGPSTPGGWSLAASSLEQALDNLFIGKLDSPSVGVGWLSRSQNIWQGIGIWSGPTAENSAVHALEVYPGATGRKLVSRGFVNSSTDAQWRMYATFPGGLEFTINAEWQISGPDANKWTKDSPGDIAYRLRIGASLRYEVQNADPAWADSAWDETPMNLLGDQTQQSFDALAHSFSGQVSFATEGIGTPTIAAPDTARRVLTRDTAALRTFVENFIGRQDGFLGPIASINAYRSGDTVGSPGANNSESYELAINCSWVDSTSKWRRPASTSLPSSLIKFSATRVEFYSRPQSGTGDTWDDVVAPVTGWPTSPLQLTFNPAVTGTGVVTSPQKHVYSKFNRVASWVEVDINNGVITVNRGFNFATLAPDGASTTALRYTFPVGGEMDVSSYVVHIQWLLSPALAPHVSVLRSRTAAFFTFETHNISFIPAAPFNISSLTGSIMITVVGEADD